MPEVVSIVVNWTGPLTLSEIRESALSGIYLVYGKYLRGRPAQKKKLLYCGISVNIGRRIHQHTKSKDNYVSENNHYWVGVIRYPEKANKSHREIAEHVFCFFCSPDANERKRVNPPHTEVYVISRWFNREMRSHPRYSGVPKLIPDVIVWNPETDSYRSGNLK